MSIIYTLIGIGALIVAYVVWSVVSSARKTAQREQFLIGKYGATIGARLIERSLWVGMTRGELVDGHGEPAAIDQKVLKTKTKEIYKYGQYGANRFRVRVTLENNEVVAFEA